MNINELTENELIALQVKADAQNRPGLDVICLGDVNPKPIEWLWPNWIAIGKVSVLAGDGGQGKSTILCDIAATTTRSRRWPDGAQAAEAGSVLILAAEDDVEDTLVPRLDAAEADRRMIFNIRSVRTGTGRRSFNLQADLVQLKAELDKLPNVRLVIIDPISSYLGKVDSHKNAEVRTVLEPLGELAARHRVAIICNNHFSKGNGGANSRIIGSVAFVNQARAAFIVTPDAGNDGRYLLMPSKMNIAPIKHGLAYRIEGVMLPSEHKEPIVTSRIVWESEPVTMTADAALAALSATSSDRSAQDEAETVLRELLAGGPRLASEIKNETVAAGVSWATVRRTKGRIGIRTERKAVSGNGLGSGGQWFWSLPSDDGSPLRCSSAPYVAHASETSTLGKNEHLRSNGNGFRLPEPMADDPLVAAFDGDE